MAVDARSPNHAAPAPLDPMWLGDSAAQPAPWRPSVTRPPAMPVSPRLLAKVGEAFAAALASLQERLRTADAADYQACVAELVRLENLGVQVQQVARVMGHEGAGSLESVDLADAVQRAVALWSPQAQARGAVLAATDQVASRVSVDPAVLEQLLDLALDHALVTGDAISLRLRAQPSSRQTLLLIDVQRSGAITPATSRAMPVGAEQDGSDDLRWLMLSQLARASGIASRRERSGSMLSLVLTFPAAELGNWYGAEPAAAMSTTRKGLHRCQVLVLDPRSRSRLQARELLLAAGLHADAAANVEQARLALRDREPDVLLTGFPVADPDIADFIDELRASQPRLAVIELVDAPSGFVHSGHDSPGWLSRESLASTLVSAVAQEYESLGGR